MCTLCNSKQKEQFIKMTLSPLVLRHFDHKKVCEINLSLRQRTDASEGKTGWDGGVLGYQCDILLHPRDVLVPDTVVVCQCTVVLQNGFRGGFLL